MSVSDIAMSTERQNGGIGDVEIMNFLKQLFTERTAERGLVVRMAESRPYSYLLGKPLLVEGFAMKLYDENHKSAPARHIPCADILTTPTGPVT